MLLKEDAVLVQTREMGHVEVAEAQVIELVSPILGFERYRRYALIPVPDAPILCWLQSLDEAQLAFPVVSAGDLEIAYPDGAEIRQKLHNVSEEELRFWVIVTIPQGGGAMRVNLRAPIVVNTRTRQAAQIVMREEYPIRRTVAQAV